jgi:hypothetical protein
MKQFAIYTGLRLVLLALAFLLVWGVWGLFASEVNALAVLIIAFVLSGLASYFLLNRQRDSFARIVEARAARAAAAFEQLKSKEDED